MTVSSDRDTILDTDMWGQGAMFRGLPMERGSFGGRTLACQDLLMVNILNCIH